ncbi:MAG TPA: glycoside hydrolase family 27 protein [Acidobacteriaceae bacterium]|nr:glycoside hydrolase family 27 protein [Acidobacteriaceae bacterium]
MRRSILLFALVAALPLRTYPQLATTPPMGWNSWDSYGMTITEPEFKQNVGWLHAHLQPSGWRYVVIDEGWYLASPQKADQGYTLDSNGRYIPAVNRFPSADKDRGFKPLADYVHSLGLKFGIHIIRGIPKQAVARNLPIAGSNYRAAEAADTSDTCRWNHDNYGVRNNAAGQAYYDSIARLYAGWGVDFVKVDCISQPYKTASIHMVSRALKKSGRPIVLSLSPGPTPLADASDVVQQAQMWRISGDFWDVWNRDETSSDFPQSVVHQFPLLAQWERYAGPGHWPDADMLPIGWLGPQPGWQQARPSRLTPDETRTVLTLWSIARSPLILGANLTRMDSATEAMLTNREVLTVDQNSTDNQARLHTATTWVWTARATSAKGDYVALFNVSDAPIALQYTWRDLGIASGRHVVRDLWLHKKLGSTNGIKLKLARHASALYRVE